MKTWLWKHRAVFGYLLIVAIASFSLEMHNRDTERRLNSTDKRSCRQRQILASNQVFVLGALRDLQLVEIHGDEAKRHPAFRRRVLADIREAERRLTLLNPVSAC